MQTALLLLAARLQASQTWLFWMAVLVQVTHQAHEQTLALRHLQPRLLLELDCLVAVTCRLTERCQSQTQRLQQVLLALQATH
jgi:hypothetical protein